MAAAIASLALSTGAEADLTVGEVAPPNPPLTCNYGTTDTVQISTAGGNAYVVPEAGVLTSWSTSAGYGLGQAVSLKVYRPTGGGYTVLAEDGPRALAQSVLNTFPIDIPVEAGDVLGLNDGEAKPSHYLVSNDACDFETGAAEDAEAGLLGDAGPGTQLDFAAEDSMPGTRVNVSANLVPTLVQVPTTTGGPPASGPPASGTPTAGPPPEPTPQCVVPRLGAKKLKAARLALKKADCRLGRVADLDGATTKTGVVVSQSPQTGKKLTAGTKVAVKLTTPKEM
jgi:hypothetical protein